MMSGGKNDLVEDLFEIGGAHTMWETMTGREGVLSRPTLAIKKQSSDVSLTMSYPFFLRYCIDQDQKWAEVNGRCQVGCIYPLR